MWKFKIKNFFLKHGYVFFITIVVTIAITLGLVLPFTFSSGSTLGNIVALNRDANSGARASFEKAINFDEQNDKYSKNVIEVSSSSQMQNKIETNKNAIGYTSAGQLIEYSSTSSQGIIRPTTKGIILDFECISPLDKDNIINDTYTASIDFNIFFRVTKNDALLWDFDMTNPNDAKFIMDSNATDSKKISYVFMTYLLYSEEVLEVLPLANSIIDNSYRISFENNVDWVSFSNEVSSTSLEFTTVGSTTVMSFLNLAFGTSPTGTPIPEDSFRDVMDKQGYKVSKTSGHTGSGDAFKTDVDADLGFLSRDVKQQEYERWGFASKEEMMQNNVVYSPWNKDAIVFYVNKNNEYYSKIGVEENITTNALHFIYTIGKLDWGELEYILEECNP